jgi:hypothetical protein
MKLDNSSTPAKVVAETQPIGAEALISNRALQPLRFLIGSWRTEGTHPDVPDTTFHGRTSFEWLEGGAFLIMHSEIDEAEIPSGVAIFGSDDGAERIYMLYFDERGVSRAYDVTVGVKEMTCRRDHPKFSQIMRLRVDGDGDRLLGSGRRSEDGAAWQDDLSLTYTRVQD